MQKEFQLHRKLLLHPENQIVFSGKEALKRKPAIGFWWQVATGLAAAVVLLFVLFNLFKPEAAKQQRMVSSLTDLEFRQGEMEVAKESGPLILTEKELRGEVPQQIKTNSSGGVPEIEITLRERPVLVQIESKMPAVDLSAGEEAGSALPRYVPDGQSADIAGQIASADKVKEKRQKLLGKIIRRNLELLAEKLSKRNKKKSSDPTFVKILDGSIIAFRTITGSEVEMIKTYDSNGRLKAYQIETETINLNRAIPDTENGR